MPETAVHGEDGLGGVLLPIGGAPAPGLAVDAIREHLRIADQPLTLVGIGPATNIAIALATEPELAEKVDRIVLMSGAWSEGNITASAEFNAWNDPEALAILLASGRPITLVTLDLTAQAFVTPERIASLRTKGEGQCLHAACEILSRTPPSRRFEKRGFSLHDPCAVAWLIDPSLFVGRDCTAGIELAGSCRGRTVIDRWGRGETTLNVHLPEQLDAEGFFQRLGERLAELP